MSKHNNSLILILDLRQGVLESNSVTAALFRKRIHSAAFRGTRFYVELSRCAIRDLQHRARQSDREYSWFGVWQTIVPANDVEY